MWARTRRANTSEPAKCKTFTCKLERESYQNRIRIDSRTSSRSTQTHTNTHSGCLLPCALQFILFCVRLHLSNCNVDSGPCALPLPPRSSPSNAVHAINNRAIMKTLKVDCAADKSSSAHNTANLDVKRHTIQIIIIFVKQQMHAHIHWSYITFGRRVAASRLLAFTVVVVVTIDSLSRCPIERRTRIEPVNLRHTEHRLHHMCQQRKRQHRRHHDARSQTEKNFNWVWLKLFE